MRITKSDSSRVCNIFYHIWADSPEYLPLSLPQTLLSSHSLLLYTVIPVISMTHQLPIGIAKIKLSNALHFLSVLAFIPLVSWWGTEGDPGITSIPKPFVGSQE